MKETATSSNDPIAQHAALVNGAGLADLGLRTQIELSGADRALFLHNLCTNEIRKLAPGKGCEAFLTSVQGKTLAHIFVFAGTDSLVIETVAGQGELIAAHLDHYLVCEQVVIADRSQDWSELFLAGGESEKLLGRWLDLESIGSRLDHARFTLAEKSVSIRRADLVGRVGFLISRRQAGRGGGASGVGQGRRARMSQRGLRGGPDRVGISAVWRRHH